MLFSSKTGIKGERCIFEVEEKRKFEFEFEGNVMVRLAKSKQANFYASFSSIAT